ncbi:hypothetical protein AMOR_48030 [Anaeromyxobacter oryzae]|uniref:Uncharacterized protein n=1 Tax=Anaeromyxobacter oryzae TaxID=2918170 RepID=A0ABM7X1Z6_9BACT|nr:hypothetical protein AMOR_48030 [Anaeromyxobacter oryzae]
MAAGYVLEDVALIGGPRTVLQGARQRAGAEPARGVRSASPARTMGNAR